ncbi:MAG: TlpA family protein disulfide reductase [Bacteroidota bacterium]
MRFVTLLFYLATTVGCVPTTKKPEADLTLEFDSAIAIDSIHFANITQDREYQFVPFRKEIYLDLKDSINDQYAISYYFGGDHRMLMLWLDGEKVRVKIKITADYKAKVDTVINSPMYYEYLAFTKKYKTLLATHPEEENDFLLAELRSATSKPYSIEIANALARRNMNRIDALKNLHTILRNQSPNIRNHGLNPLPTIEVILANEVIDFSKFRFYDRARVTSKIAPPSNGRLLLDFWFIGCGPCLVDHQKIIAKFEGFKRKKVEVIGISIDDDQDEWEHFVEKKRYPWKNLREIDLPEDRMRAKFDIYTFPTYLLVDGEGRIEFRSDSLDEVMKVLGI